MINTCISKWDFCNELGTELTKVCAKNLPFSVIPIYFSPLNIKAALLAEDLFKSLTNQDKIDQTYKTLKNHNIVGSNFLSTYERYESTFTKKSSNYREKIRSFASFILNRPDELEALVNSIRLKEKNLSACSESNEDANKELCLTKICQLIPDYSSDDEEENKSHWILANQIWKLLIDEKGYHPEVINALKEIKQHNLLEDCITLSLDMNITGLRFLENYNNFLRSP